MKIADAEAIGPDQPDLARGASNKVVLQLLTGRSDFLKSSRKYDGGLNARFSGVADRGGSVLNWHAKQDEIDRTRQVAQGRNGLYAKDLR